MKSSTEPSAVSVPVDFRRRVSSGIAHPAGDGGAWCRLAHAVTFPARDAMARPSASGLSGLRRALALHTRRRPDRANPLSLPRPWPCTT
ncbi:DUF6083 domain-containing protein [Streptomyces sp. NPDC006602]|uniref:DUF6083 domain-containing protein n=1 Tax=Streptomyces sp. NPDC006602 TaxID=3364751 RepID=UPI00367D6A70